MPDSPGREKHVKYQIPESTHRKLKVLAARQRRTMKAALIHIIEQAHDQMPKEAR